MRYRELSPCSRLLPFVECFWFVSGDGRGAPIQTIVPDGCPELIVHSGEPFRRICGERPDRQPTAFVVGELTRALRVRPEASMSTMGIRFRPAGLSPFVATPQDELTDRTTPIADLWGASARELEERVHDAASDARRARVAEEFLLARLAAGPGPDRRVAAAVGQLLAERGQTRLGALSATAGLSPRQLERRFRSVVGLGPKALGRLVRFQEVYRRLGEDVPSDWASIALDCGYYDQAHLLRDFRELAGSPPSRLLGSEGALAREFVDPARLLRFFAHTG
ncbi:MAG TPA: helix-turn-helix domain-containing protein [Vicinamibacteria bacterium]